MPHINYQDPRFLVTRDIMRAFKMRNKKERMLQKNIDNDLEKESAF